MSFSPKTPRKSKRHVQSKSMSLTNPNILVNNSHVLREDEILADLQRKQRSISDGRDPRSCQFPVYHSEQHEDLSQNESYYTIYRDPKTSPSRESFTHYYDEKGKSIDPVDLLFEDPSKRQTLSPAKLFKRFGRSKNLLPCIGAKELEYRSKQSLGDAQLNIMPSLTSMNPDSRNYQRAEENAIVDSAFEDMCYDRNTRTYKKKESSKNSSRVSSRVPSRVPSSNALSRQEFAYEEVIPKEKMEDKEEPPQVSYLPQLPFSIWDCVTYVASFLPPVPLPDLSVSQDGEDGNKVLDTETNYPEALEPPFRYTKELPQIPQEKQTSRVRSKMKGKIREFAYPESSPHSQRQASYSRELVPDEENTYNRNAHPNFNRQRLRRTKDGKPLNSSRMSY